jgi:hypothetical protein
MKQGKQTKRGIIGNVLPGEMLLKNKEEKYFLLETYKCK